MIITHLPVSSNARTCTHTCTHTPTSLFCTARHYEWSRTSRHLRTRMWHGGMRTHTRGKGCNWVACRSRAKHPKFVDIARIGNDSICICCLGKLIPRNRLIRRRRLQETANTYTYVCVHVFPLTFSGLNDPILIALRSKVTTVDVSEGEATCTLITSSLI